MSYCVHTTEGNFYFDITEDGKIVFDPEHYKQVIMEAISPLFEPDGYDLSESDIDIMYFANNYIRVENDFLLIETASPSNCPTKPYQFGIFRV